MKKRRPVFPIKAASSVRMITDKDEKDENEENEGRNKSKDLKCKINN